jgi:protein-S-isoprenylcysteine O-methyltransferase Ste14
MLQVEEVPRVLFLPIDEELFFRLSLLVLLFTYGAIRSYYERKVRAKDPGMRKRRFRLGNSKYERRRDIVIQDILAAAYPIPVLLYIIYPPWRTWFVIPFPVPIWVQMIGLCLAVLSLIFLVWTHRTLGLFWTFKLEIREKHKLVTSGPYSRIRHPMYAALLAFMFATGIIAVDWLILVITALNLPLIYKRIEGEEQMMIDHFGNEYLQYMRRTRRLLPRLRRK